MELTWKEIRPAGNRGTFYPKSKEEIEKYIRVFSKELYKIRGKDLLNVAPKAIVSPHAGTIYSGFTANVAHKVLSNAHPKRIVVVGPSHHVYFEGVSAAFTKYYKTPYGMMETDKEFLESLHEKFNFLFSETVHYREHSTETQMPFIAHYNPQAKIVELIYGDTDEKYLAEILTEILKEKNTAVVISSDLSHFYSLETAQLLDNVCIKAFERADLQLFNSGCEACGIIGIKALIKTANAKGWETGIFDYRTSADASGDTSSVVGYMSGAVWEKK